MKTTFSSALLATQNALLGVVIPELRAVVVDVDENNKIFRIIFYYTGKIDEEILEIWSCASTEASCQMPLDYRTEENYIRCDFPQEISFTSGRYAYLRKE